MCTMLLVYLMVSTWPLNVAERGEVNISTARAFTPQHCWPFHIPTTTSSEWISTAEVPGSTHRFSISAMMADDGFLLY